MITKLIVAGGRKFNNQDIMVDCLTSLYNSGVIHPNVVLVCGMAKGADIMAYNLWKANELPYEEYPADWLDMSEPCVRKFNRYGEYNALAGMKRNHFMGDIGEGLVCFWDGVTTGSKDMIDYMFKLKKPIYVFNYKGELTHEYYTK